MYLGLDLGTSGLKALLINDQQRIVGQATAALTISRPHDGWSEQDPADWIAAAETALDSLKASHGAALAAVRGIGLSGQMHGATMLDASDRVLRPCILWNDTRSYLEAGALDSDPRFRQISGNIVFPGFTAPKLVWLKSHEPAIFARTAKVLLPKDYLRLWLTGEHVTDMSDAAGTGWLDTGSRRWSEMLLGASGMSRAQMPRLVEGAEPSGQLRRALAGRWGMSGAVVAGGAGDNAASAVGTGVVAPGSAFVSLGTSGVLFAATESYRPNPESAVHTFCHAIPQTWHQMGVILSASAALEWFAGIAGSTPETLVGELAPPPGPPAPLLFLPYLSGERTPHNDAAIRGAFLGLAHGHDRRAMTRAILDGVAFALRDNLEALKAAGTRFERVIAVGGGARSHYWLHVVANALDMELALPASGELGAAFGAARLGLIAAEHAEPIMVCTPPETAQRIGPSSDFRAAYEEAYGRFRSAYRAVRR